MKELELIKALKKEMKQKKVKHRVKKNKKHKKKDDDIAHKKKKVQQIYCGKNIINIEQKKKKTNVSIPQNIAIQGQYFSGNNTSASSLNASMGANYSSSSKSQTSSTAYFFTQSAFNIQSGANKNVFMNHKINVTKGVNVIVKTNFVMAGRKQQNGTRTTKEAVGSHASAAINYIENHGGEDLEQDETVSNLYDETGNRISKEDFQKLRASLEKDGDVSAMRRVVISPKEDLTRDEMKDLTMKTFQEFQERTGKNLNFKFAIHTDTDNIHSHIVITGTNADINFSKKQLGMLKSIATERTKEIEKERNLEKSISIQKEIVKDIRQEQEI